MREVPEMHSVLLATDSHGYISDVFDSHSRLQASSNKTGSNVEHRIWVVKGLFYMMARGVFDKRSVVLTSRAARAQATRASATF